MRTPERASARILVVDDEASVVEFAERALRAAGYTTMTATSGDAAMQICEKQGNPDLLLTDLRMPRMTGDELAGRLRKRDPDLKVLYLTGYSDQLFRTKQTLWDGEAFLDKPCSISGLLEAVSLLLRGEVSSKPIDT